MVFSFRNSKGISHLGILTDLGIISWSKILNNAVNSGQVERSSPLYFKTCPIAALYPLLAMEVSFLSSLRKMKKSAIRGRGALSGEVFLERYQRQ